MIHPVLTLTIYILRVSFTFNYHSVYSASVYIKKKQRAAFFMNFGGVFGKFQYIADVEFERGKKFTKIAYAQNCCIKSR